MSSLFILVFFNDTATTEIYTLSLHDALPISIRLRYWKLSRPTSPTGRRARKWSLPTIPSASALGALLSARMARSEEHTSELQSRQYLVCRLLLEKKKNKKLQT